MFYIYRNLHQGLKFSIRVRGKVIDRVDGLIAGPVQFKVGERGRLRVIQQKQKNVHAFVVSEFCRRVNGSQYETSDLPRVTYNPYENETFMCEGKEIHSAAVVLFTGGNCYVMHL